jgi:2-dehydropantoate 2-reductase
LPTTPHQPSFSRVAVIGPGAIGCCVVVRLAAAGFQVTLIDHRPDRAARLSARPIVVHAPEGDLAARLTVRTVPEEPPDLVLLAVKAYAARAATEAAAKWIGRAPVVTLENGLGVAGEVGGALPATTVITGVIYQGANLVGEGEVNHVANVAVYLGYEGRGPDALVEAVAATLRRAGFPADVQPDMTPVVWGKLLVNAAINPTAALAGVTNGEVAERPTLRALAQTLAEEGEQAARAAGVTLPYPSTVEAVMATARQTADNRCSMLQDLEAGRATEVEYLNGAIVRVGEAHGVATPANRAAAALIRQVSAKGHG